jgi:hypothetical protein
MKKLIAIILAVAFVGCASISLKPQAEILTELQKTAVSTVGYLVIKNNPDYVPKFKSWYENWKTTTEFELQQAGYQAGIQKLSELISKDPFLQLQMKNALAMMDITFEGPQVPGDIEQYNQVIDCFMLGVSATVWP